MNRTGYARHVRFFGDEPWADVEPYAARVWSQLPTPHRREDVRDAVSRWFAEHSADQ
jgi:hypothetical protein